MKKGVVLLFLSAIQVPFPIPSEIHCTERSVMITFILRFLLVHRKFHVFLHPMLLAEKVIVKGAISGIRNRIVGIETTHSVLEHRYPKICNKQW